jgi:hypothetical protein
MQHHHHHQLLLLLLLQSAGAGPTQTGTMFAVVRGVVMWLGGHTSLPWCHMCDSESFK